MSKIDFSLLLLTSEWTRPEIGNLSEALCGNVLKKNTKECQVNSASFFNDYKALNI